MKHERARRYRNVSANRFVWGISVIKKLQRAAAITVVAISVMTSAMADEPDTSASIDWQPTVDDGWIAATEQQRPLLLFVTKPRCSYCDKLKAETLSDARVVDRIDANYVAVHVASKDAPKLVQHFQIKAYPTTLVVSPDAQLLTSIRGFLGPEEFLRRLDQGQRTSTAANRRRRR